MLLLIGTEASLFGCLIASYFYVRFSWVDWPQGGLPERQLSKEFFRNTSAQLTHRGKNPVANKATILRC